MNKLTSKEFIKSALFGSKLINWGTKAVQPLVDRAYGLRKRRKRTIVNPYAPKPGNPEYYEKFRNAEDAADRQKAHLAEVARSTSVSNAVAKRRQEHEAYANKYWGR